MAQWQATIVDVPDEEYMARGIGIVQTHPAITPWRADLAKVAPPAPIVLSIDNVTTPDSTTVRIDFNVAAKDNVALRTPDNYVVTPTLEVLSVSPEAGGSPTYVLLTTEEQKQNENYSVEIQNVVKKGP